jgi:hypothetical protein
MTPHLLHLRVTVSTHDSAHLGGFVMFVSRIGFLLAALMIAAAALDAAPAAAAARGTEWSAQSARRPRIEIRPGRLYRRECVDGLQVSHKYVGRTVLMPYMRCWWVRG